MQAILYIGLGGAAGSILRYLCQQQLNGTAFPYGTLVVNLVGCLLIGILWSVFAKAGMESNLRLLLMTGFCGGFTTFSAFTLENIQLLQQGKIALFFLYAIASVAGGLLATFAGYKLVN